MIGLKGGMVLGIRDIRRSRRRVPIRTARRSLALALMLVLVAAIGAAPTGAGNGVGEDISRTADGTLKIKAAAASFAAQGSAVAESDLVATRLTDGDVLVSRRDFNVTKTEDGYRTVTPKSGDGDGPSGPIALSASWTLLGSQCFAALFRGVAHMDTCYRRYKMAGDGDAAKDYWRLDLYATMFAEGRTLDWGWVAGDRDAGPALSFVDWSPAADVWQGCGQYNLSITVAGFGAGFGATFCELNNISKSAGAAVGWFKDYWDWNVALPVRDRDRSVAIEIGASSTQGGGSPVWGLSWNFAAH